MISVTQALTNLGRLLAAPGTDGVVSAAPQVTPLGEHERIVSDKQIAAAIARPWSRTIVDRLDGALNRLVSWSGSVFVFAFFASSVITWALLGIVFGDQATWQVFISDYQALLTYFFDSLLMRQQLRESQEQLKTYAAIQSRLLTYKRLAALLQHSAHPVRGIDPEINPELADGEVFPEESRNERYSRLISNGIGHVISGGLFWVGIVIWLAFGSSLDWSDTWQLYINSATSALMVLLFAFLAYIREQQSRYTRACLSSICAVEVRLELALRRLVSDSSPNARVTLNPLPKTIIQRVIDYYANLISMLFGVILLTIVVIVWAAIGPAMQFDDSWWLLIGTYAGLIGMNDGFVLRNIDQQLSDRESKEFEVISNLEEDVMDIFGISSTSEIAQTKPVAISNRISLAIGRVCAHRYTVVAGFLAIVGLIATASALNWSETGQLICNVPPSIIESFFMLILITGHNLAQMERHAMYRRIHQRRVQMIQFVASCNPVA